MKFCENIGRKILLQVYILVLLSASIILSQSYNKNFTSISVKDGLSQRQVGCILQDSIGFMWFGTHDGLNRFDGYNFTVFRYDPTDSSSISHNFVNVLYEDTLGNIWVGTDGGLNLYQRKTGKFIRFLHKEGDPESITHNLVYSIYCDIFGTIWVGTKNGLNRYNWSDNSFTHFFIDDPNDNGKSNEIHAIEGDSDGKLWLGSYNGLHHFDPRTGDVVFYRENSSDQNSLSNRQILALMKDSSGYMWIGTFLGGVCRFDLKTKKFTVFKHNSDDQQSLSNDIVRSLYQDNDDNIWVGTEGALNLFDKKTGKFHHYIHDPDKPGISGNEIISLYQDRSGILWIGTNGLDKIDPNLQQFKSIQLLDKNPRKAGNYLIWKIIQARSGRLWIASDGSGLKRWDHSTNEIRQYLHNPSETGSLSSNQVVALHEDRNGIIWAGTSGGGLNKYNPVSETFKVYKKNKNPNSLSNNYVSYIIEDQNNYLWISTMAKGINRFDPENEVFKQYVHNPKDPTSLNDNYVWVVFEDHQGTIWVGTKSGGLNRLIDAEKGIFKHYMHDDEDPGSISSNTIYAIYEDTRNNLWVGTQTGLNKFNPESGTFEQFYEKDGLSADFICAILEDDAGCLWISTVKGLTKYCPEKNNFKTYGHDNGLANIGYNIWSGLKTRSGEMLFTGPNGIDYFHPEAIKDNKHIPPVVITDFQLFNRSVLPDSNSLLKQSIFDTKSITLDHDQSVMTFKYTALNYTATERNRYQFKMDGYDPDWRPVTKDRSITYTNLDPGEYTFLVKAANNDGVWNTRPAALEIIIIPPWWKRWWAYLMYILLATSALYLVRKSELNRQKLKYNLGMERVASEKMKELDTLKSRFFANISHEFRTPLTLILGPLRLLRSGVREQVDKQYAIMERNAERLLRLINQLLDLSQLESNQLNLQVTKSDILLFLKRIVFSFESLATERNIRFEFNNVRLIGDQIGEEIFLYFDSDKMEKVVVNLLSNAFKFTPINGEIRLTVLSEPDGVQIKIKDSGIGMSAEQLPFIFDRFHRIDNSVTEVQPGSGIGLALCQELVKLHKGKLMVKSEPGQGSEFSIFLLKGREHFTDDQIKPGPDSTQSQSDQNIENHVVDELNIIFHSERDHLDKTINDPENAGIILIVEDNNDMRSYISEILQNNFQIITAQDGNEGLEKAVSNVPDLIISDVMMPGIDGYQLCEQLKTAELTGHIPVILLTAKSSGESKIEGLEIGADDYLTKPFDARELKVRVKNLIEQRKQLRERFTKTVLLQPGEIAITSADEKFLNHALQVVSRCMSDLNLDVEMFASEMAMSRMQLHRKLKALINQSASEFIRSTRLQRAVALLNEKAATISEISYEVGFSSPAHFSKVFKEQFGKAPSEYTEG